jgi:hypothetical protein
VSGSTVTKSQLERSTAVARLEVAQLREELSDAQAADSTSESLKRLTATVAALQKTLDLPVGLRVEQAARLLRVSKPTAKKWVDEGLLKKVPDRAPIEITQESVLTVRRILGYVRQNFPARLWTAQLAAFLHDRDIQQEDWFLEGVRQAERGEFVDL